MFREQAILGGLELRVHLPRRHAVVLADPILLRQAVVNLTHNALRYTQKGRILLAVRRRGNEWLIEVWDTGMGIAAGTDHQVFSPYYRSPEASHMDSAGHGLGLAVVARCAKLMNATYGFQSRIGKGSRFWLRLCAVDPLLDPVLPEHEEPTHAAAIASKPLAGQCLVLDDDLQVIAAWKAMLEDWGIEARFATTAAEAFTHIERGFVPAAIFCDQRLRSGESGFDVLRQLLSCCPGASGAMVSGEFNSAELTRAEDEGYLVFRKPLDLAALHAVLETWLNRRDIDLVAADPVGA
jgi:CheY-like chemotaxis protein